MVSGFLSPVHIALIVLVVVMLFGAKRLPEMGRSVGSGLREFRQALDGREARHRGELE